MVSSTVNKALNNLKTTGTLALDKISDVINIKERLSNLANRIDNSVVDITNKIKWVETLSNDFRNTTAQIKNFTRSLFGKVPVVDPKQQGLLAKSVIKGLKQIVKIQDKLQNTVVSAFCKIDDLQKEVKGNTRDTKTEKKESVSNALKECKNEKNIQKQLSQKMTELAPKVDR